MSASRSLPNSITARPLITVLLATLVVSLSPPIATQALANPGIEVFHELPSVDALLERYVEAVGGRDALMELGTRVASVRVVTDLERDPPVHEVDTLSVYGRASGEFLVVTRTGHGMMMEGYDGDEEWKIDLNGTVFNFHAKGGRDRWMTDPQFPLKLRHYFPDMEVLGPDVWGDDWVYVVDIDGDESHRLGFDVETGLLTRLGYNRELREYRKRDGVLMPMRVAYSRKGGSSTFLVDAIEHNAKIDPILFSLAK